jgi:biotin transporter BioY
MNTVSVIGSATTPGTSDILAWLWGALPFIIGAAAVIIIVAIVLRRRKDKDEDDGGTPKGPGSGSDTPRHSA